MNKKEISKIEDMFVESKDEKVERFRAEDKAIINSAITNIVLQIATLPKIDLNDADQIYSRCIEYFEICSQNGIKPTQEGCANALKISTSTLRKWLSGNTDKSKEVRSVLNWLQSTLQQMIVQQVVDGGLNPVTSIFLMKNNFGYTDETKVVVQKNEEEQIDKQAILDKYK